MTSMGQLSVSLTKSVADTGYGNQAPNSIYSRFFCGRFTHRCKKVMVNGIALIFFLLTSSVYIYMATELAEWNFFGLYPKNKGDFFY